MTSTSTERMLAARAAAYARWSRTADTADANAPMRDARLAPFEAQVDPDGKLTPDERWRRAEQARKVFMTDMARRAVPSQPKTKAAKDVAIPAQ
jgi:hypothetical protein